MTFIASCPIEEAYLVGRLDNGKVVLAKPGKDEMPTCIITDEGRIGDLINIQIMGSNNGTMKVLCGAAVTTGDLMVADENSKARSLAGMPDGEYDVFGISLSRSYSGCLVEFTPILGLRKTVKGSK